MYKVVANNCLCCMQKRQSQTEYLKRHMLRNSSELSIMDFYCVFVPTEMILIAFFGSK